MDASNPKKTLVEKMFAIQGLTVEKLGINPHYKSQYATLDSVVNLLLEHFKKEKILIKSNMEIVGGIPCLCTYLIDLESGEREKSAFPVPEADAQKRGAAITYGRRYNLVAMMNLLTEEDDDGNAASGKPVQVEECPRCKNAVNTIPAGVSKKTGNPYDSFKACSNRECDYRAKIS